MAGKGGFMSVEDMAADLERRVHQLEVSSAGGGNLKQDLLEVRATLAAALEEAKQNESHLTLLKEEREAWLKREGKYVYQIEHLKKSVREVLDREAKATAAS